MTQAPGSRTSCQEKSGKITKNQLGISPDPLWGMQRAAKQSNGNVPSQLLLPVETKEFLTIS
jgi:hypothetical protein